MPRKSSRRLSLSAVVFAPLALVACSALGSGEPVGSVRKADSISKTQEVDTPAPEVSSSAGAYIPYDDYARSPSAYADTAVVLFFNASWCSTCKKARDNIQADLSAIPEDLTIVVVDFDTAIELRRAYDVGIQHTFVHIDNQGNEIKKWSGSTTTGEIYERVQ